MLYTLKEHQQKKLIPKGDNVKNLIETIGNIQILEPDKVTQVQESVKDKKKRKLIVKMEAIHEGRTRNYTYYTAEGLKSGLTSWTTPYNKPVLLHHKEGGGLFEEPSDPIGRILKAEYSTETPSGKPGLIFTCEISDPDAIEKVLDGRYSTVSIGASTDKVTCNICGTDRTEEYCEHYPGETYDDQTCHFIIGTTMGREVSYVNTPADPYAGNFSVQTQEQDASNESSQEYLHTEIFQIAENLFQNVKQPEINLYEHVQEDVKNMIKSLLDTSERSGKIMSVKTQDSSGLEEKENHQSKESQQSSSQNSFQQQENHTEPTSNLTNIAEANAQINVLEKRIAEMQSAISEMVVEKTKMEHRISEMKKENESLLEENTELREEKHKSLAEKVVNLKMSLQKSDVIGKEYEEAVKEHIERTQESLEDSLKDLEEEAKKFRPKPGSVQHPGYSEENINQEESQQKESQDEMTGEEALQVLTGLFAGGNKKYGSKK